MLTAGVLALAGVLAARPALVALALPLLVLAAVSLVATAVTGTGMGMGMGTPSVQLELAELDLDEDSEVGLTLLVSAEVDLAALRIRVEVDNLVPLGHRGDVVVALRAGEQLAVSLSYRPQRWGRATVGPVTAQGTRPGWLVSTPAVVLPGRALLVRPRLQPLAAGAVAPEAGSYAGSHRARAAGDGVALRGLRPFQPGDRLRRISWRAAARTGGLPVVQTDSERATHVVVMLDSTHDLGTAGSSSLDLAVRGAAALARHWLAAGDVVAMVEYGGRRRVLPGGSGRAQLERARVWLADTRAHLTAAGALAGWPFAFSAAGSLTVVFSPLVDDDTVTSLIDLKLRGTHLVTVDTLDLTALPAATTPHEALAQRLWRLEREETRGRLADLGVPVVRWSDQGGLDLALGQLARLAARPRAALR